MSESGQTHIVAQIYVTQGGSNPAVSCTHRVKTGAGLVLWLVHNNSEADLTNVKLTNFSQADGTTRDLIIESGSFNDLSTGPIPKSQLRTLAGKFNGHEGDVYNYDIEVDNHIAADPQLEI